MRRDFPRKIFLPTEADIIRAKLKTSGIIETNFTVNDSFFVVVDVGGQRSERRKWIHAFDSVTAIIFLVALDDYNKTLEEDNSVNRFRESLDLFSETTGLPALKGKPFVLFLNKIDIFREKIKTHPLSKYFPEFPKDIDHDDFDKSVEFLKAKFVEKFRGGGKLSCFLTCVIDKDNTSKIYSIVMDIIIREAVSASGF